MIINQKLYEIIRWTISIVLPALSVFFSTLANAWGWNLPTEAIVTTISAVALFLGTIFGISKVSYDKAQATEAAAKK